MGHSEADAQRSLLAQTQWKERWFWLRLNRSGKRSLIFRGDRQAMFQLRMDAMRKVELQPPPQPQVKVQSPQLKAKSASDDEWVW